MNRIAWWGCILLFALLEISKLIFLDGGIGRMVSVDSIWCYIEARMLCLILYDICLLIWIIWTARLYDNIIMFLLLKFKFLRLFPHLINNYLTLSHIPEAFKDISFLWLPLFDEIRMLIYLIYAYTCNLMYRFIEAYLLDIVVYWYKFKIFFLDRIDSLCLFLYLLVCIG